MKTKFFIALVVLTGLLTGCKNDKSVDSLEVVQSENVDKNFKVTLNAIVSENDSFQLYYTDEPFGAPGHLAAYKEEVSIWVDVKAGSNPQDIVFSLPENVVPTYLRLDTGTNTAQKEITIKKFTLSYNNKLFETVEGQFFNFFLPNESIQITDKVKGVVKPVKMPSGVYDPMFYSDVALNAEIQKLVK